MKTSGLSLVEAHASGRKYRRTGHSEFVRLYRDFMLVTDAIATDYELEPQAKLITRGDILLAVNAELHRLGFNICTREVASSGVADRLMNGNEGDEG